MTQTPPPRPQAPLPRGHRRPRAGRRARDAPRGRDARRGLRQAADRHRVVVERDHPLQPVAAAARAGREGGRAPRRRLPDGVRHDLGLRRDLDGPRRDALLAGQPRGHRRLGGDGRPGRAARRDGAARRLRQEPARHADGGRPARPRRRVRLRRLDPARVRGGAGGEHRRRLRGRRRLRPRADHPRGGRRDRARHLPRRRAPAAACTPRTRWPARPRRSAWRCPARRARRPSTAAATGSPARPARPWSACSRRGITARQILTREAFENAIAVVMAFGGSTNAVLHLLAIAHEAGVPLDLDDFNRVGDRIPHLADVKPFGAHVMSTVDKVGGVPVVMRALLDAGLLHGDALTVTGATVAENLAALDPPDLDGAILRRLDDPIHPTGGITILRGSLAPGRRRGQERRASTPRAFAGGRGCSTARPGAMAGRRGRHAAGRRRRRDPLRGPARRSRACGRCSPSPGRSRAPGSARTSCC